MGIFRTVRLHLINNLAKEEKKNKRNKVKKKICLAWKFPRTVRHHFMRYLVKKEKKRDEKR